MPDYAVWADARSARRGKPSVRTHPRSHAESQPMNSIIYIVGLVVIILFIAGYFGLR